MKNIPLYEVDQISTLKDMIINSEKKFGDKPAFLKKVPGIDNYVPVTYKQYKKDVDAPCICLQKYPIETSSFHFHQRQQV